MLLKGFSLVPLSNKVRRKASGKPPSEQALLK
jgi:hypothetical protein